MHTGRSMAHIREKKKVWWWCFSGVKQRRTLEFRASRKSLVVFLLLQFPLKFHHHDQKWYVEHCRRSIREVKKMWKRNTKIKHKQIINHPREACENIYENFSFSHSTILRSRPHTSSHVSCQRSWADVDVDEGESSVEKLIISVIECEFNHTQKKRELETFQFSFTVAWHGFGHDASSRHSEKITEDEEFNLICRQGSLVESWSYEINPIATWHTRNEWRVEHQWKGQHEVATIPSSSSPKLIQWKTWAKKKSTEKFAFWQSVKRNCPPSRDERWFDDLVFTCRMSNIRK